MPAEEIPEDVRRFLFEHVEGYDQLEVLVLLRGQTGRGLSADELAGASKIPVALVDTALEELCRTGFVERLTGQAGGEHRYLPRPTDHVETIERLSQVYRENPLGIVKLMNANALERVRTSAMRAFANAFVLGGKK